MKLARKVAASQFQLESEFDFNFNSDAKACNAFFLLNLQRFCIFFITFKNFLIFVFLGTNFFFPVHDFFFQNVKKCSVLIFVRFYFILISFEIIFIQTCEIFSMMATVSFF